MQKSATIRKALIATLALSILLWAEAGLALLPGDQVMQCTMTMHDGHAMADDEGMSCCPDEGMLVPSLSGQRPPCCSMSNAPEHPLGFVVSSDRTTSHPTDAVAYPAASLAPRAADHSAVWRSADASRFVKPVLELKTDLRI